MAKVTGNGGVLFKSQADPAALAAGYQKHGGCRWRTSAGPF